MMAQKQEKVDLDAPAHHTQNVSPKEVGHDPHHPFRARPYVAKYVTGCKSRCFVVEHDLKAAQPMCYAV